MQPLAGFLLVVGGLCAEAEYAGVERREFGVVVAEAAGLRGAAAGAGDFVPAVRQLAVGAAGHGVEVDHVPAGEAGEVYLRAVGGGQGQMQAGEMRGGAVVLRNGQIAGQGGEAAGHHALRRGKGLTLTRNGK